MLRLRHRDEESRQSIADPSDVVAPKPALPPARPALPVVVASPKRGPTSAKHGWEHRSYDGSGNNLCQPALGRAESTLMRIAPRAEFALQRRPSAREISNIMHCSETPLVSENSSLLFMAWSQLLAHELCLTGNDPRRAAHMKTPEESDRNESYPSRRIPYYRAELGSNGEPLNLLSSYLDGSSIYGDSLERAAALRTCQGDGKLKCSLAKNGEQLLPLNSTLLENLTQPADRPHAEFFLAGDLRANENVLLTAVHTLLLREHNFWCEKLLEFNPSWRGYDEMLYQQARSIVVGVMQSITYNEWLPHLLGKELDPPQYQEKLDPRITNEFAACAAWLWPSMAVPDLLPNLTLRKSFFVPEYLRSHGVDALLLSAAQKPMQPVSPQVVDDVRSFLVGDFEVGDLAALSIQRGRDHGLPDYNSLRAAYGLPKRTRYAEVSPDPAVQARLKRLYGAEPEGLNQMDGWVGGLAEQHRESAQVGELFWAIISEQFRRTASSDRFWFEIDPALSEELRHAIRQTRMAHLLRRNCKLPADSSLGRQAFQL